MPTHYARISLYQVKERATKLADMDMRCFALIDLVSIA